MENSADELVTAETAGRILGLKTSSIRRMTHKRELPCVRPTGRRAVRYRRRELEALLRARTQPMRTEVGRRRHRCAGQVPEPGDHREGESQRPDLLSE